MPLTPRQITETRFSTRPLGYDKTEVRVFLNKVSSDYAAAICAIAETHRTVQASEMTRLVAQLQVSARALLLAAERRAQSARVNVYDDQPSDVLDEAANLLCAAADALEQARDVSGQGARVAAQGRARP
jgi:DivIVA domain-containing protein